MKNFKGFFKKIYNPLIALFNPFITLFNLFKINIDLLFHYYKNHRELVILSAYGFGFLLQLFIILSLVGFEGLNYISIKFSIIMFALIIFLSLISIPFTLILLLIIIIISLPYLILMAVALIGVLFIISKMFPPILNMIKNEEKTDIFYYLNIFLLIIILFIGFLINYFHPKPIYLGTENNGEVVGKLLFFNQKYYFLNVCDDTLIIPNKEVNSIEYPCKNLKCNEKDTKKIKKDYNNLCTNRTKNEIGN